MGGFEQENRGTENKSKIKGKIRKVLYKHINSVALRTHTLYKLPVCRVFPE
jgi:hypothetical protein